jgi:hypothetical protein
MGKEADASGTAARPAVDARGLSRATWVRRATQSMETTAALLSVTNGAILRLVR